MSGASTSCSEVRDARDRAVDLALGEPQEREPGLGVAAPLVRRRVRLLGAGEVPAATADLADLVVPAGGDAAVEVAELLARGDGLQLRRGPVAPQAHDLRAVESAGAGEAADVGLVAPAVRGLGPLRRAPEVADVLAGADRHAVDDPGREGSSSPHTAAALASSWSASPCSTSPLSTSARAFPASASICVSRSPMRWPSS